MGYVWIEVLGDVFDYVFFVSGILVFKNDYDFFVVMLDLIL